MTKNVLKFICIFFLVNSVRSQTNVQDSHIDFILEDGIISCQYFDEKIDFVYLHDKKRIKSNYASKDTSDIILVGYSFGIIGTLVLETDTIKFKITDISSLGNTNSGFGYVFESLNNFELSVDNATDTIVVPLYTVVDFKNRGLILDDKDQIYIDEFSFVTEFKEYFLIIVIKNGINHWGIYKEQSFTE